jgi:hypothetical protein
MSTVRQKINVLSQQESSFCRKTLFMDPVHDRQLFLDALRQRREFRQNQTRSKKFHKRLELALIMTGAFMLMGILTCLCT